MECLLLSCVRHDWPSVDVGLLLYRAAVNLDILRIFHSHQDPQSSSVIQQPSTSLTEQRHPVIDHASYIKVPPLINYPLLTRSSWHPGAIPLPGFYVISPPSFEFSVKHRYDAC